MVSICRLTCIQYLLDVNPSIRILSCNNTFVFLTDKGQPTCSRYPFQFKNRLMTFSLKNPSLPNTAHIITNGCAITWIFAGNIIFPKNHDRARLRFSTSSVNASSWIFRSSKRTMPYPYIISWFQVKRKAPVKTKNAWDQIKPAIHRFQKVRLRWSIR